MNEPRTTTPTDPISVSQISSMQRCPQAYLFRYGMGMIEPPKWAFAIGKAVEHAVIADYAAAIRTGVHLPTSDVRDITRDTLVESVKAEPPTDKGYDVGEAVDHVTEAAGVFHEQVASKTEPTALEIEVVYKVADDLPPVRGFVDVTMHGGLDDTECDEDERPRTLIGEPIAVDNKTSGAAGGWGQNDVAASLQPVAYVMGLEAAGQSVAGFQFHVARYATGGKWLKTKVSQVLTAEVGPAMKAGWTRLVRHAVRQRASILESGVALPLYGWQCKGCGFREACAMEWGREPPK